MSRTFLFGRVPLLLIALPAVLAFSSPPADPLMATLHPKTVQAWDTYLQWADERVNREISGPGKYLIQDYAPPDEQASIRRTLEKGEIYIGRRTAVVPPGTKFSVEDGQIHHWWGSILLPRATLARTVQFLQDYDHHAGRFADLEKSKILSRDGQIFKVFLRLRRSASLVTVYYNTEEECFWTNFGSTRTFSRSNATRIAEIADPGTRNEREKIPGEDRGFLWRLASWWRLQETDRGVILEVESASLSRDIPTIVRLIPGVSAYINSIPKDSLRSVLTSVRTSLAAPPGK